MSGIRALMVELKKTKIKTEQGRLKQLINDSSKLIYFLTSQIEVKSDETDPNELSTIPEDGYSYSENIIIDDVEQLAILDVYSHNYAITEYLGVDWFEHEKQLRSLDRIFMDTFFDLINFSKVNAPTRVENFFKFLSSFPADHMKTFADFKQLAIYYYEGIIKYCAAE